MKKLVIREYGDIKENTGFELDLREFDPKDCKGCWSCWLKTPGNCIYKDLDEFYKNYLKADRVVIFAEIRKEFITGRLKTLLDRMIPLYLPYIEVAHTGCNHDPRYDKYPDIEFYYRGHFKTQHGKAILEDFIIRTFTQFRSKNIVIKEIE